jgi:thymidylate synthase
MLDDGAYKRDQLAFVVWELSRNPASRRAIINLYDPSSDPEAIAENKIDIPCTQNLSFMVRNGKLDLTVFIRSNDLVWGFSGVNVFEFTVLQQLVSEMTKIPLGNYYHVSNNLHVYPRHREMVQNIARLGVPLFSDWRPHEYAGFIMTIDDMDSVLNRFFVAEEIARTLTIDTRADFLDNLVRMVPWKNTLLHDLAMIVFADAVMRSGGYPASKLIEDIQCAQSRHIMEALWKKRYMKEGEK